MKRRTIDLTGSFFKFPNGVCSIDLDGDSPGKIAHAPFATTPGATYVVSFLFSANGDPGCHDAPTVKTMEIEAAEQTQEYTWDTTGGHDANNGDYTQETWQFTATGTQTGLSFTSLDRPLTGSCGPAIAVVSVTPA